MVKRYNYLLLAFAALLLFMPNVSHAAGTSAPYDEQLGITYTQDYTSLAYNVTAIAQSSSEGYGPAYLLNGYSNTGYWYQIGLSYNWSPNAEGFYANYEVFSPSGQSIFPQNGGGGILSFSGSINQGDKILLNLYFSNRQVIMFAKDLNTGAYASTSYSAEGASEFIGNPYSTQTNGYFTGLMTEWYHTSPYYGNEQGVNYSIYGSTSNSGAWLWVDEFYSPTKQLVFLNSTQSPIYFNNKSFYGFYSNGAIEYANPTTFITGNTSLASTITSTIPNNQNYTTTISYPFYSNSSIININYNTTLPQISMFNQVVSISGIGKTNNLYLTNSTELDVSGINNLLNITSSSISNLVLLDLSGIGNNITLINGNISVSLSGINNILVLKNTKARILTSVSGINNTIYLINSTLVGGNKFGIDNKIISYQRGISSFSNETTPITIISTTTIPITTTPTTTIQHISQNTTTTIRSNNQTSGGGLVSMVSNFINSIVNFFASIFGTSTSQHTTTIPSTTPYTLNSTTSIYTTTMPSFNCMSMVNIGTDGSSSTGGNCSGFVVNIGTYGTYKNYQNACPSVVNIGTYGTYYNNVTGCSPIVNVGTDAKYYNING